MRKITKVWLITAGSLVLIGLILFAVAMSALKWDFTKLSASEYETNITEINETFNNISVLTETADVVFALSDDEICKVECYEDEKSKHTVSVENDTLIVKINNQKSWYDYIGFSPNLQKITVYLPKDYSFGNVDISLSTGDVNMQNTSVGTLNLSVTTGDAYLTDIVCENLISSGSSGDITLNNVLSAGKISVERSTGDVKFNDSDAAKIYVKTNTGDVTGNLLSSKVFVTDTNIGSVDVPKTDDGGKCEIITSTGDIKINVN